MAGCFGLKGNAEKRSFHRQFVISVIYKRHEFELHYFKRHSHDNIMFNE